ncbi:hypothetical protein B0H19DRAFT_1372467 [Mycena capillaripes]|nr:hypothetical protein B0H19DRAFT_1372467 [Mycena capillaripes]
MRLLDLNYDALLRIFALLDVLSALRSTQVSVAFRRLALSKHVWLAVVTLRDLGPSSPSEPALLSGDKHLLVKRGHDCEIWDISEDRQIWARTGIHRSHIVTQPVNDGTELLIALWTAQPIGLFPGHTRTQPDYKIVVQLLLLDLKANSERQILSIQLPQMFTQLSEPLIDGDFWAADVQWVAQGGCHSGILIVNWREKEFVLLNCEVVHKKILPGYLLGPTDVGEKSHMAAYCPFKIVPINLQEVDYPALPGTWRTPLMTAHDCLLQRGSYIVFTHTASTTSLPSNDETYREPSLHRYRLTLPTASSVSPIWEHVSAEGTLNCVFLDSFTYAGYGLSFPGHSRRLAPRTVCRPTTGEKMFDGTWTVPLQPQNPDCVCLSPITSALTVCSARGADIYYYE